MRIAAVPGSYDPVTLGHVDIIRRAAALFDRVYVVAMANEEKTYLFTPEERLALLREAAGDIPGVIIEYAEGYFYEYARARGAVAIVKGVRDAEDYAYEREMALFNREHLPTAETLLLPADPRLAQISSRRVKVLAARGHSVFGMVTARCEQCLKSKLAEGRALDF